MPKSSKGMSVEDLKRRTAKRLAQQKKREAKNGGSSSQEKKTKPSKMTVQQLKELTKQRQLQQQNSSQTPMTMQPITGKALERSLSTKYHLKHELNQHPQYPPPSSSSNQYPLIHPTSQQTPYHNNSQSPSESSESLSSEYHSSMDFHLGQQRTDQYSLNHLSYYQQQQQQYVERGAADFSSTSVEASCCSQLMIGQRSLSAPTSTIPLTNLNVGNLEERSENHDSTMIHQRSLSAPSSTGSDNDESYKAIMESQARLNELLLSWSSDSEDDERVEEVSKNHTLKWQSGTGPSSPKGKPSRIVATTTLHDQISYSVAEFVLDEPPTPPTPKLHEEGNEHGADGGPMSPPPLTQPFPPPPPSLSSLSSSSPSLGPCN